MVTTLITCVPRYDTAGDSPIASDIQKRASAFGRVLTARAPYAARRCSIESTLDGDVYPDARSSHSGGDTLAQLGAAFET